QTFAWEIVLRVVAGDLRADLNCQRGGIELRDSAHRRSPLDEIIEEALNISAGSGKDTHACNNNSSHACSCNCGLSPLLKPAQVSHHRYAGPRVSRLPVTAHALPSQPGRIHPYLPARGSDYPQPAEHSSCSAPPHREYRS